MLVNKNIINAARKKAAQQRADYRIKPLEAVPGAYFVKNAKTDATYLVDTAFNTCQCPAFKQDGFCKHFAMIQNDRREDAELAAKVEEMEYAIADRDAKY